MTTYQKIKELLDAKLETLSAQLDASRRISILKFKELKEDGVVAAWVVHKILH